MTTPFSTSSRHSFARNRILRFLGALAFSFLTFQAHAQTFPNKPIRIVVPFGPGGIADLTTRIVAQKMSQDVGQNIVIDNKPSAGGIVAAEQVSKSEPDGYTLLLMSNGTAISASTFLKLPFDPVKDFIPLSTFGSFDLGVVVNANSRFNTLSEVINAAKASPGKINVATINIGSTQNLAAELLKSLAGVDFQVIPFNGTPAVITAIRGSQVDLGVEILGPLVPQIQSKAVRLLAVSGTKRSSFFPDIPTVGEIGVKNYVATSWNGLAAPAKTPPEIVNQLAQAIAKAVNDPEVKRQLRDIYVEPSASSPKEMKAILERDIAHWGNVVEKSHLTKQ